MSDVLIITVETHEDSDDFDVARNSEIYACGAALKKYRESETKSPEKGKKKEHKGRDSKKAQKKYTSVTHITLPRRDAKGNKIEESVDEAMKAYREQLKGKKFCRMEIIGHGSPQGLLGPGKKGTKDEGIGDSKDAFSEFIRDFYNGPTAGGPGSGSSGADSSEEEDSDEDVIEENNIIIWACDCGATDSGATLATIVNANVVTFDGIVDFWAYEEDENEEQNEKNRQNGSPIVPPQPKSDADAVVNTPVPDTLDD